MHHLRAVPEPRGHAARAGRGPRDDSVNASSGCLTIVDTHRASPAQLADLARLYDANLAYADEAAGILWRALGRSRLSTRTAFIVTADHGEALGEHGFIGHNEQVYEESAHVPLLIRLPAGKAAGRRVPGLVELSDLGPTLLHLLGRGSDEPGPNLLASAPREFAVTRSASVPPRYAVRSEEFCYVADAARGRQELYDRRVDPGEHRNLASASRAQLAHLSRTLEAWLAKVKAEGESEPARPTEAQRENLKALGYVR